MKSFPTKPVIFLLPALAVFASSAQPADVTVGFKLVYGPWKTQMERLEKEGLSGKSIEFVKFTSGTEVINAMASRSVDISLNAEIRPDGVGRQVLA